MDSIASGSVKKIEKLLEAGLDPNFTTEDKSKIDLELEKKETHYLPTRNDTNKIS